MNDQIIQMIASGNIPYRYEVDPKTGTYFGLLVLGIIVVYAIVQAMATRLLNN